MLSAELLKVRSHRVPWIVFGALVFGLLIGALVMVVWGGNFPQSTFTLIPVGINRFFGAILALSFGAWLGGGEFRWGTWKTVLSHDNRRTLHWLTKVGGLVISLVAALVTATALGLLLSAAGSAVHGLSLDTTDLVPETVITALRWFLYGLVGFSISFALRNIAVGTVIGLAFFFLGETIILAFVEPARPYLLSVVFGVVSADIGTVLLEPVQLVTGISAGRAWLTLGAYVVALLGVSWWSFKSRDV